MSFIQLLAKKLDNLDLDANTLSAPNSLKLKDFHKFDSAVTGKPLGFGDHACMLIFRSS